MVARVVADEKSVEGKLGAETSEGFLYGETPEEQEEEAVRGDMWGGDLSVIHQDRVARSDYIQSLYDEAEEEEQQDGDDEVAVTTVKTKC